MDEEEDVIWVAPTASMDDETFTKHLELRHGDEIGGMRWSAIPEGLRNFSRDAATRGTWELYHQRLHRIGEYEHDHLDA